MFINCGGKTSKSCLPLKFPASPTLSLTPLRELSCLLCTLHILNGTDKNAIGLQYDNDEDGDDGSECLED